MANNLAEQKEFKYLGYTCLIRKLGFILPDQRKAMWLESGLNDHWYCGYVRIPTEHPFHGLHYTKIEDRIVCHGGLTYSENEADGWTIGFDCNHYGDNPITQNQAYTANECMHIVDQLIALQQGAINEIYEQSGFGGN